MSTAPDDFYNSPASLAFSNTSMRQRTQQACDKCRERKTKCSGEKPVCKRCTTRGLICQYTIREARPRGTGHSLRNSVSSIELGGVAKADGHQMHKDNQRDSEPYYYVHQHNNIIPYELASQSRPAGQAPLRHQQSFTPVAARPTESHSQSPSPLFSYQPPQHLELSPTSSEGSVAFHDNAQPRAGSSTHTLRRAQSYSGRSHHRHFSMEPSYTSESFPPANSQTQHTQHHHARSLDMEYENRAFAPIAPPTVPKYLFQQENPFDRGQQQHEHYSPPFNGRHGSPSSPGTSHMASAAACLPATTPTQLDIYNPTPTLPLVFSAQMLAMSADEDVDGFRGHSQHRR